MEDDEIRPHEMDDDWFEVVLDEAAGGMNDLDLRYVEAMVREIRRLRGVVNDMQQAIDEMGDLVGE